MKHVYEIIKAEIDKCADNQEMFTLPNIDDCDVIEKQNPSNTSTILSCSYEIKKGEDKITVLYESKDKCRTFQIKPDRNIVSMQLIVNGKLENSYSNAWDDKM